MMQSLIEAGSVAFGFAGFIVLLVAVLLRLRWVLAVPVTLELWTAMGLLRLIGEVTWLRIAAAASIVAIRRLITPAFTKRR